MSGRMLCVLVAVGLGACPTFPTVDPAGRPCNGNTRCGPGTHCDPQSSTCVPNAADARADRISTPDQPAIAPDAPSSPDSLSSDGPAGDTRGPDTRSPDIFKVPDQGCPAGLTACGPACVDLATSFQHCGACFNACPASTTGQCVASKCVCGGTGGACGSGLDCVSGACACVAGGNCAGCCSSGTSCLAPSAQTLAQCGQNGAACKSCDDANTCTTDSCSAGACQHVPKTGTCNDNNPCTHTDTCVAGSCVGTPSSCNDGLSCTADACTGNAPPNDCTHTLQPNYCLVGGACHANQALNPADACQQCLVSFSTSAWFLGPGCVTTIAGSGATGTVNGPALSASFNNPRGLALEGGKIYIADWTNNRIRLLDAGQVSTFAGTGVAGLANGALSTATFDQPNDLVLGPVTGNLYVADNGNNVIRTISSGNVSTFAGASTAGFVNGSPTTARFNGPNGLAADPAGKIYISDSGNHAVRMFSSGLISTVAGTGAAGLVDGAAATAQLNSPFDVAVDAAGAVLVADRGNHRIRKIFGGQVSTVAGSGTVGGFQNGAAASARFNSPVGVAVSASGTIYVGDEYNHRIRAITGGNVTTFAGTGVAGYKDGPLAQAQFDMPGRLVVDSAGLIYVCDPGNQRIRLIRP